MSDMLVGILGLICIIGIVVTLFKSRTQPAIAFIVFPAVLGLILVLGGRYSFDNLATMIKSGFSSTAPTAALRGCPERRPKTSGAPSASCSGISATISSP